MAPRLALAAFVEGLAPGTTKERLREHFADCGNIILAVVAVDSETGRCVGKVKFSREAAAQRAVEEKDGTELDGCRLAVRDRPPEGLGEEVFDAPAQQQPAVFAVNLGPETTSESLRAHFSRCGGVTKAEVAKSNTRRSQGYGKVDFTSEAAKQLAMRTLHESELDGRRIGVKSSPGYPVFVGGLVPEVNAEELKEHFAQNFDVIFATLQMDRDGLCRGSGRVELASEADRRGAIAQLHGSKLRRCPGSTLLVKEYLPSGEAFLQRSSAARESLPEGLPSVFVGGMAQETTVESLKQHFAACGHVVRATLFPDKEGRQARSGKLHFAKMAGKRAALNKMNFTELDGSHIVVREFDSVRAEVFPVLVANLGPDTKVGRLAGLFLRYGRLRDCRRLPEGEGQSRGLARADFFSEDARRHAVRELDGLELDGRALSVREWLAAGLALFVANVGFDVTEEQLRAHCQRFGEVAQCQIFMDKDTGKSLGRAKVDFASRKDKEAALAQLPNTLLEGRQLSVREHAAAPSIPGCAVWVSGLGADMGPEALRERFGSVGVIKDCRIVREGRHQGKAKIEFARREDQQKAIQAMHLSELQGQTLSVREFVADASGLDKTKRDVFPVFVSGLSPETTVKSIMTHFQAYGEVRDCRILAHRETNRSRGLGRVDFATEADQLRAATEANGTELDGRVLNVRRHDLLDHHGRPITRSSEGSGFAVLIASLPTDTTLETLREHFAQAGQVVDAQLLLGPDGRSRGMAKVWYLEERQAHKAVAMLNDSELEGRLISVRPFAEQARGTPAAGAGFAVSVGGLALETTAEGLRAHFAGAGTIRQCTILRNPESGRSRGLARVEYALEEAQRAAIARLHQSELDGRVITVREFQQAGLRTPVGAGGFWVSVEGLAPETTASGLRLHFRDAGAIKDARIVADRETGRSKGVGKVEFVSEEGVLNAVGEFDRTTLDGRVIAVREYDPQSDGGGAAPPSRPGRPAEGPAVAGRGPAKPAQQPAPAEPEEPKATARKLDPDDGQAYTFAQMCERYRGRLSEAELRDRWEFDCADAPERPPAAGAPAPGRRVDPEDGKEYSFEDFRAKAMAEGFGQEEILEYWNEECLPSGAATAVGTPVSDERRLDPEDGAACTFADLEAKLRGQFSDEEILEYWRHDCVPVSEGAP